MKTKIEAAQRAFNAACEARDAAYQEVSSLADDATDEDSGPVIEAFDTAQAEVERCKVNVDRLTKIAEARDNTPAVEIPPADDDSEKRHANAKGGKAEQVYTPTSGVSFFRDLAYMKIDPNAQERIVRHMQVSQETRDVTIATEGAGISPPNYLPELIAEFPRQGRPVADAVPKMPLPAKGMNITLPAVQTATAVAVQAAEAGAVQETNIDINTITTNVNTIAGQQDVSRQLLDRSDPSVDVVIFGDLIADYDEVLDTQLLSGSGANGQHTGITTLASTNAVTYTDGTPTGAELWPKLYDAIQQIHSGLGKPPTHFIMHPRRAAWLASQLSSTFPLLQQGSFMQKGGAQDGGMTLSIAGLPVIVDGNMSTEIGASTDEDEIFCVRMSEFRLAEGELQTRVFEDVLSGTLQVRLQVFAYSAFVVGRQAEAIAIVAGTGLKAPTF